MSNDTKTLTLLLDPRARKAQLSAHLGPVANIRSGRLRVFAVSVLTPYSDRIMELVKAGNLHVFSEGLTKLTVEEARTALGGTPVPSEDGAQRQDDGAAVAEAEAKAATEAAEAAEAKAVAEAAAAKAAEEAAEAEAAAKEADRLKEESAAKGPAPKKRKTTKGKG